MNKFKADIYKDFDFQRPLQDGPAEASAQAPLPVLKQTRTNGAAWAGQKAVLRQAVIERTRAEVEEAYLNNLAQNTGYLAKLPDLGAAAGGLSRTGAAFLVGSGPSLDQNGHLLKEAPGKGLIIAAASSLKPLLALGVRPQVVVVIEAGDTSDFLRLSPAQAEFMGDQTVLALASGAHPAHFKVPGFVKAAWHLHSGEAYLFGQGRFIAQGGNCGTAALALAYHWGLAPLILVGQDQAFMDDRLYAEGAPGGPSLASGDLLVDGIDGRPVWTHSGLWASLSWYEEAAAFIRAQPGSPPLFNAAAAGAQVPGFTAAPLERLLAGLPQGPPITAGSLIARASAPPAPIAEVAGDLERAGNLLASLIRLNLAAPMKAARAVREAAALSPFLGRLLGRAPLDSPAGRARALTRALGLAGRAKLELER